MKLTSVKASARKSLGEFKPLLVFSDGSTKVVEQSEERQGHHTKFGFIPGKRYARGTTYPTKAEAISAAQAHIDLSREHAEERLAKYEKDAPEHLREKLCERVRQEVRFWGGQA